MAQMHIASVVCASLAREVLAARSASCGLEPLWRGLQTVKAEVVASGRAVKVRPIAVWLLPSHHSLRRGGRVKRDLSGGSLLLCLAPFSVPCAILRSGARTGTSWLGLAWTHRPFGV